MAAGLLVQRMPRQGAGNPGDAGDADEDYQRIATLAASLTREELLALEPSAVLQRLFWQEKLLVFAPRHGADGPQFACTCSRERVAGMLRALGQHEVQDILRERGNVEVGCEYCGQQYRFDAVDAAHLFTSASSQPPAPSGVQ